LPFAADEPEEYELLQALAPAAYRNGEPRPEILAALGDKDPARRAAGAFVLARTLPAEAQEMVVRLLGDKDTRVRLFAARALVRAGGSAGLPVLIALLGEARLPLAWQAEALLTESAGARRPATILTGSAASRKECRAAWEAWWKAESGRLDLSRVRWREDDRGSILVAELDEGRLANYGRDYRLRWETEGPHGPLDVQLLPSGRLLVAENHAGLVSERDRSGKVVREMNLARPGRSGASLVGSCQRLPDGHTLIATRKQLQEADAEGNPLWSVKWDGLLWDAHKLRDGRIVALTADDTEKSWHGAGPSPGHVAILSAQGKELGSFGQNELKVLMPWSRLTVLPNGPILVPCRSENSQVVDYTLTGEKVWECGSPPGGDCTCAARLPNGHTLVAMPRASKVLEVDRGGKVVHELKIEGRPWHVQVVR